MPSNRPALRDLPEMCWIADDGHAWLRLPLHAPALARVQVSRYSYRDRTAAYLEEDCDAPRVLLAASDGDRDAARLLSNSIPVIRYGRAPVRDLPSY